MPSEDFSHSVDTRSSPDTCWQLVTDVSQLVSWISILGEATEIEPLAQYSAVLVDKIGPFKLRADLDIRLSDVVPGQSLTLVATGEDRQVSSRIRVNAVLTVQATPDGSSVGVSGSYEVTGRVATMGAGTIRKKATKLIDEFFDHVTKELGGEG